MGQGVGTDEVPAEDTRAGPGMASQVGSHSSPVPGDSCPPDPCMMLGWPALSTHTISLGSSLVSGGGLMST